jgi:hypothetical protein
VQAGVPSPAAHLLSNFYNETRAKYYAQLDRATKSGGDVVPFLTYAVEGFVDGLREQLKYIQQQQLDVTWENFVHDRIKGSTASQVRRKHLLLDLPGGSAPVSRGGLARVSSRVAAAYARKGERTLTRDINALVAAKLLVRKAGGFHANRDLILAFLPIRHVPAPPPNSEKGDESGSDG